MSTDNPSPVAHNHIFAFLILHAPFSLEACKAAYQNQKFERFDFILHIHGMMDGSNLRRMAAFHAVAASGGITAAARILHKSPPAVHNDLKRFQQDVGVALIERVGRSMRLTPAGRYLYEVIDRALDEIERARSHARLGHENSLPLRIGAVSGFGRYRLVPKLFTATPPSRPIELHFGTHEALLADVLANRIDLILTYRAITAVPIESEKVAREELVLATSASFPANPSLADLERLPCITYDEYEYVFAAWFAACFKRQPETLHRSDHCSELEEALAAVAAGRGYTIAPKDACLAGPWSSSLVIAQSLSRECHNDIFLCGTTAAVYSADARFIGNMLKVGL